jgi:hypothetical protein
LSQAYDAVEQVAGNVTLAVVLRIADKPEVVVGLEQFAFGVEQLAVDHPFNQTQLQLKFG